MTADVELSAPVTVQRFRVSLSIAVACLGVALLYSVGIAADGSPSSTFVAQSAWHMAAVALGGGVMLLVGLTFSIIQPDRVIGPLATGVGVTWLAPEVAGWAGGPQWIRSAALALGVMFVPLLLHLGLACPDGSAGDGLDRRLIALAHMAGLTASLAVIFLYEPFLDLHCWRTCSTSPYVLLRDPGLSQSMIRAAMGTSAALAMAFVWRASARVLSKSRRDAGVSWWVLGLMIVLASTQVTYSLLVLDRQSVDSSDPLLASLVFVEGVLLTAVGLRIAWGLVDRIRRTRSLAELVSDLEAGASGPLAAALAHSLRDPSVEVAYWIPSLRRHVDSEGRGITPTPGIGRAVATLERSGVELGKVIHNSHLSDVDLAREIGAAAKLAVDNERLRAELLAQANEIRRSQERIVVAGDAARRGLERDLHDGAQQSLLALSYKLRIAETEARREGADEWVLALRGAIGQILTTIHEVRTLAHGIFPSVLVDAGLGRALETLREESEVHLEIDLPDADCGDAAAIAIYQLVTAVINAPGVKRFARISVTGRAVDGLLLVNVEVPDPVSASALTQALDRIGALGGTVDLKEMGVYVELPCG